MIDELIYKEESYAIQGAIFEVYREMGCGFLEAVYQECLEKEFRARKIPFVAQSELHLSYNYGVSNIRWLTSLPSPLHLVAHLSASSMGPTTPSHLARMPSFLSPPSVTEHVRRHGI